MLAPSEVLDLLGLRIRDKGRVEYQGGFNIVTGNSGAASKAVRTFAKYIASGSYNLGSYQLLMATRGASYPGTAGSTALYSWSSATRSVTSLAYSFTSDLPPLFASLYGKYFLFGKVYDGVTLRDIGPPRQPPDITSVTTSGTPGVLSWVKEDPLGYAYTVVDSFGLESNPSDITFASAESANQKANTIVIPAGLNGTLGRTITGVNIYRTGGGSDELLQVNPASLGPAPYNNGTGASYDDFTAEFRLGNEAPYDHIPPENGGLNAIYFAHGDRLWIGRYGGDAIADCACRLGFSNRYSPENFGNLVFAPDAVATDVTSARNYQTAGGTFDIDTDYDNPILALSEFGGLLVIFRKRSIHLLEGDNQANFNIRKHAEIGIAGPLAHAKVYDTPFFLGSDGMVYRLTNYGVDPVGLPIERTLLTLPKVSSNVNGIIAAAVCVFHRQEFIFAVPGAASNGGVIAFALDLRYPHVGSDGREQVGAWRSLNDPSFAFNFGYSDATGGDNADLILAPSDIGNGYDHPGSGTGMVYGLVAALTKSDRTPELVQLQTGWFSPGGQPSYDTRIRGVRVLGDRITLASGETAAYITIQSDADRGTIESATYQAYTAAGGWIDRTTAGYLKGRRHQVMFSGVVSDLDIASIELDYTVLGEAERS